MASKFSIWLNKKLGLPVVRLSGIDEIVGALAEQVAKGKSAEIVKKLPDMVFISLYRVFQDEAKQRESR